MKKYKLLKSQKISISHPLENRDVVLYRIKALRNFSDVKKGDIGGWVESEKNLSHEGNCWIYDNAQQFDNSKRIDNACSFNFVTSFGNSIQSGNSKQLYC